MCDFSIAIFTYSGRERAGLPAGNAAYRVERLLASIAKNTIVPLPRVVVCDDYSENVVAQRLVRTVAERFGAEYHLRESWGGVCANYNQGVRLCDTEWVFCLSDDTIVSRNWLVPMLNFIGWNQHIELGQVGWPCVFAYQLVCSKIIPTCEAFYGARLEDADPLELFALNEDRMGLTPFLRGNCSGCAFGVRRSIWAEMGGFPEDLYQPDEFYAWWVWTHTNGVCVQVPAPPVLHYGGASSWGEHAFEADSPYVTCNDAWLRRTGTPFAKRGWEFKEIIRARANCVAEMRYDAWWDGVGRREWRIPNAAR